MAIVVGVEFKPVTRIYSFDAVGFIDLEAGEYVVVDTAQGREVGKVVTPPREVAKESLPEALKPVVRRAKACDMLQKDQFEHQEAESLAHCRQKAAEHGLPMKVVRVEYNYDASRLMVYYLAEKRVDFRDLVRDLAKVFKTRVEMKQIGARDEAKMLDGMGRCGQRLCCSCWLRDFYQISIKMAKSQDLPLNPSEISGVCGRLLCCLSYENDTYTEMKRCLPKSGARVMTPKGVGTVLGVFTLRQRVEVRLEDESVAVFEMGELQVEQKPGVFVAPCSGNPAARQAEQAGEATDDLSNTDILVEE
jgi:cell fate regulator YaaT (PSP1 superfamily)